MVVPLTATPRTGGMQPGEFMDPVQVLHEVDIQQGMTIADFGAGSGFMTIPAAKMVGDEGKIYAVEVQKQLLGDIQSKSRAQGALNVQTVWADLEIPGATKIPTASVDIVLLVKILFQVPKKDEVLKEAFRVLKPGGKLILAEWKKIAAPMGPPLDMRVDRTQIEGVAQQVGFQIAGEFNIDQYHYSVVFEKPGAIVADDTPV